MSYERNDMVYRDYQWTQKDSNLQVVAAEAFQPKNGNSVLNMINSLTANVFDGTILEIIIHEYIPQTIKTFKQAYEWIKDKGEYYYKHVLRSIAIGNKQ